MGFDLSAGRVWRRLGRDERLAAARHFWADPASEAIGVADAAVIKVLHVRPQAVRTLSADRKASALASVSDPSELLAASLLVALHLGERRELLGAFLDAASLPHDHGLLAEDASAEPVAEDVARTAAAAVLDRFPREQVRTYLNTLWLQDHDRWEALDRAVEPLGLDAAR